MTHKEVIFWEYHFGADITRLQPYLQDWMERGSYSAAGTPGREGKLREGEWESGREGKSREGEWERREIEGRRVGEKGNRGEESGRGDL